MKSEMLVFIYVVAGTHQNDSSAEMQRFILKFSGKRFYSMFTENDWRKSPLDLISRTQS